MTPRHSLLHLLLVAVVAASFLLVSSVEARRPPGDEDNDGIITGPRLVGNTTFRGCFVSGPKTDGSQDTDWDKDVDTITDALDATSSWDRANMTELKNGKRQDIVDCINVAKMAAVPGDEFIFFFSGHGGDFLAGGGEQGESGGTDNHILVGDTNAGTRDRITDDDLADMLSGFKKSVTLVVVLDSCYSHTFFDGADDLGSVTQKDGTSDVPAGPRIALIAASSSANPTCGGGFTDRLADGLSKVGDNFKADASRDGVVTAKEAADHARGYMAVNKPKCDGVELCPIPSDPESTYLGPVPPDVDNCPTVPNPGQEDSDGDGIGDACEIYFAYLSLVFAAQQESFRAFSTHRIGRRPSHGQ